MAIDTKHEDLQSLRIDRTQRGDSGGEPPAWARRYILGGVAVVVLLGVITLAYRAFSSDVPEVEVVRAAAETSSNDAGGTVLSATGYIVAHHTINVNSKVTGRLAGFMAQSFAAQHSSYSVGDYGFIRAGYCATQRQHPAPVGGYRRSIPLKETCL